MGASRRVYVAIILIASIYASGATSYCRQRDTAIGDKFIVAQSLIAIQNLRLAALLQGPVSGPVNYVYDDLGRLVAAIDAAGNAAVYSYDAVGNILSIQRFSSTDMSIISFTPEQGPSGASVTITGTGFSATTSQNSVQFNGIGAAVISSTTNQIVASVPVGATTGPITVISPLGSVTSTNSFTVTTAQSGSPQITSFSPQIVASAAAVSVSGANFDSVPANNRLKLNTTAAAVPTGVSSSSMAMTVPAAAGSGRISLSTPAGLTSSSSDLFVPPSPFTVSQVGYTGRATPGTATTVSIPTANKIGLLVFDGLAGQKISILTSSPHFSPCSFQLYKPDNTAFGSTGNCAAAQLVEPQQLPMSGTYTVLLNATSSASGSVVMTIYQVPPDPTNPIIVGGPAVTVQNTVPGQNARLTFAAAKNQHVSISILSSTFTNCTLTVYQPNANLLPNQLGSSWTSTSCNSASTFFDVALLPVTGTYTLLFDPNQAEIGTIVLKLNDATDVTGTISPGGAAVTSSTTVPGQNIRLSFNGTAGQIISAAFDNDTFPQSSVSISLLSPTGATVKSTSTGFANGTGFLEPANYCTSGSSSYPCSITTLPATGTYTLLLDPSGASVGTIRTTLYNVPPDQSSSANLGDPPVSVNLNTPAQNSRISFSGTQNHKLSINMTNGTFTGGINATCRLSVVSSTGVIIGGNQNCYASSAFFDIGTLPSTGTYTVVTDPFGNTTGGTSLQLYDDTDLSLAIAADGVSHTVTTTVPGQNVSLSFTGTSGQKVFGVINSISGYTGLNFQFAQLIRGTSTLLFAVQDGSTFNICNNCGPEVLPANDTYVIFLNPNGADVGSATVTLYTVPADFSGSADTAGTPVVATTSTPGQNAQITFSGTSGQSATISLTSGTYPASHCQLSLKKPDGTTITSGQDCSGATHSFGPYPLTVTGTYTITIDPQYAATGNVTVAVTAH